MKGRKPKPAHLHSVHGNPGKRPLKKDYGQKFEKVPKAPTELTARAKKHWPVVAKRLFHAGVLARTDIDGLIAYCEAYGAWREAMNDVARRGEFFEPIKTVTTKPDGTTIEKYGPPVRNPYLNIANKEFEKMSKLLTEFGMTPSSRTRVSPVPGGDDGGDGWGAV